MTEKQFFLKKNIQDIEIKMLRIKNDCYIKIIPSCQNSDAKKSIMNISSGAARHAIESWSSYCSTKAALDMYSEVIHIEQQKEGRPNPVNFILSETP